MGSQTRDFYEMGPAKDETRRPGTEKPDAEYDAPARFRAGLLIAAFARKRGNREPGAGRGGKK